MQAIGVMLSGLADDVVCDWSLETLLTQSAYMREYCLR
jgi:hypothetical protein